MNNDLRQGCCTVCNFIGFKEGCLMTEKKFMDYIHSKRFTVILSAILILCVAGIYGLLVLHEKHNTAADITSFEIYDSSSPEYMYCFDPADDNGNDIRGWLIHKGESTSYAAIKVALREQGSDTVYIIPTETSIRKDVTEAMNDGCSYDVSGFSASSGNISPKLDTSSENYTVYLYSDLNGREFLVDTGIALSTLLKAE